MKYTDVENALARSISAASASDKRALAVHALAQLTTLDGLDEAIANDFDPDAAAAFRGAVQQAALLDAHALTEHLDRIDEGDLSDGDMDSVSLRALNALESWRDFQIGELLAGTTT